MDKLIIKDLVNIFSCESPFKPSRIIHPVQRTIFTTPIISPLVRLGSIIFMKLAGWKVEGSVPPNTGRAVLIAAPHTSNWDLPYTLMTCFILGMNGYWLGKDSIFKAPFGGIMRWLGGIPVDRKKSNNLVAEVAERLRNSPVPMHLLIPPEGSRSKVKYWKTGFYYIAATAQVPILMAFMDYPQKRAGLGSVFHPTGDIEKDMVEIKAFYAQFTGKYADKFEA